MADNDHNEPYWPFANDGRRFDDRFAPLDAMDGDPPAVADAGPDGAGMPDDTGADDDAAYGPHPWSDSPPTYPAAPPPPPPYAQQPPSGPYAPQRYDYPPPPAGPRQPPTSGPPPSAPPPAPPPLPPEAYPGPIQEPGAYYYEQPPSSEGAGSPLGPPPDAPYESYGPAPQPYQAGYAAPPHAAPPPSPPEPPRGQPPPPGPPAGQGAQPPPAPAPYPPPYVPHAGSPAGQAPPWGPPAGQAAAPQTAESLSPETLLRGRKRPPSHGWRRAVYKVSAGIVHPGESPAELRRQALIQRARTPVLGGHHRAAVMSLKGGVGKTTTTVGLGSTLASLRGDRVVAVDANPDRGTLSDKVRLETAATVRDLLGERAQVQRYADVRAFTSQTLSRLEVLASDRDPAASEAFSDEEYRAVATVLEHYYSICLTDCGTGLLHSAMSGVLGLANQIILVSSPSVDGARSASATLDWLAAHEYGDLVRGAVVVLSTVRPKSKSTVDIDRLEQHFANRCRAVVRVPYDPHLEEGAEVDLERLRPETRDAYLTLAATVGDGFARAGAATTIG